MDRNFDTKDGASLRALTTRHHREEGRARFSLNVLAATLLAFLVACDPPSVDSPPRNEPHDEPTGVESSVQAEAQAKPASASEAKHAGRLVAFGDSLTAGLGVAPEETYPAHLQRWLDEAGYSFRVVNAGVSGETSAGGLRRVDWVLKSNPILVVLELGGNDGLRGIDPAQTRANLEAIIRKFLAAGVPVVLVGMKLPPNYGGPFTKDFADIYPDLAQKYDLPFMPFFLEGVALNDQLTQADGIHPTGPGYEVIARNLAGTLGPVLGRIAEGRSAVSQPGGSQTGASRGSALRARRDASGTIRSR